MKWLYLTIGLLILGGGGYMAYEKTRGVRNNNPGNIKFNPAIQWLGQIGQDANGFVIFNTMANGIRAIGKILLTYNRKYGLDTVRGLITRWSATDQTAYVANVSNWLGVSPDAPIDVKAHLHSLVSSILRQENGTIVSDTMISAADITDGVDAALA